MSHVTRENRIIAYVKTNADAQLISTFVFTTEIQASSLFSGTGWFESDLVKTPEDQFSWVAAHIV